MTSRNFILHMFDTPYTLFLTHFSTESYMLLSRKGYKLQLEVWGPKDRATESEVRELIFLVPVPLGNHRVFVGPFRG